MVEPYQSRYEALSQQPTIPTNQTLHLPKEALDHLERSHSLLHIALRGIHEFLTQGMEIPNEEQEIAEQIRSTLLVGSSHHLLPRHTPVFMTAETVFDADDHPYIVSINCHAPRHWDILAHETRSGETALTTMRNIIEVIRSRTHDGRAIKTITDPNGRSRFPNLEHALNQAGLKTDPCTIKEAASDQHTNIKQLVLDLPLLQGTKKDRKSILDHSSIIIEPFAHLSSQSVLAVLTDPRYHDFISEWILHGSSPDHLRTYLPDTIPLGQSRPIENSYIVKHASPLSSQRTLGRYGQISREELERQRHAGIAQQAITPKQVHVPAHGIGPFRCISVSYAGHLIAAFGVVRMPANGSPSHDISVKISVG